MAGTERPMWSAEKRDEWNFEESGTEVEVALGAIAQAAIAAAEGFLAGFSPALLAIAGDLKTAVGTFGYSSGTDASNKALVTYDEESKTYASMVITKTQTSKTGMVPGVFATKHTIIVKVKVRVATAKNDSAMDACQKLIDAHVNGGLLPLLEGEAIFGEAPPAPQQQQQQQQQQQDPSPTGPAGPSPSPAAPAGAASQVAGGGVNAADELRRKKQKEELRLKREKEAREQFNPDEDVINEVEELLLMAQECQEKDGYGDREMVDFLNEGLEGEDEEKQGYARAMFFARFGIECDGSGTGNQSAGDSGKVQQALAELQRTKAEAGSRKDADDFEQLKFHSMMYDEQGRSMTAGDRGTSFHDGQSGASFCDLVRPQVFKLLRYLGSFKTFMTSELFMDDRNSGNYFFRASAKVPFLCTHYTCPTISARLMQKYSENPFNPTILASYAPGFDLQAALQGGGQGIDRTIHLADTYLAMRSEEPFLICVGPPRTRKSTLLNSLFGLQFETLQKGSSGLFHDAAEVLFSSESFPAGFNVVDLQGFASADMKLLEMLVVHMPRSLLLVLLSEVEYVDKVLALLPESLRSRLAERTFVILRLPEKKAVLKARQALKKAFSQGTTMFELGDETAGEAYMASQLQKGLFQLLTFVNDKVDLLTRQRSDLLAKVSGGSAQGGEEYTGRHGTFWMTFQHMSGKCSDTYSGFRIQQLPNKFRERHVSMKKLLRGLDSTDPRKLERSAVFPCYSQYLELVRIRKELEDREILSETRIRKLESRRDELERSDPQPSDIFNVFFQSYMETDPYDFPDICADLMALVEAAYLPRIESARAQLKVSKSIIAKNSNHLSELKWKMEADNVTPEQLKEMQKQQETLSEEQSVARTSLQNALNEMESKVLDSELFLREAKQCCRDRPDQHTRLVDKLGRDFQAGKPLEIIDGDSNKIDKDTLVSVFEWVHNIQKNARKLLVITILGPQSSGKSTLLNYLFGAKFHVSAGRCTKGLNAMLLRTDFEEIKEVLVLDSEGIFSIEKQDPTYDRKLAIFCMSVSNVLLINIKGELSAEVQKVMEVAIYAVTKIVESRAALKVPKIMFVLRDQISGDTANMEAAYSKLKSQMREAAEASGTMLENVLDMPETGKDIVFLFHTALTKRRVNQSDVLELTESNGGFRDQCAKLRWDLINSSRGLREEEKNDNLVSWIKDASSVWTAVQEQEQLSMIVDLKEINNHRNLMKALGQFRTLMSTLPVTEQDTTPKQHPLLVRSPDAPDRFLPPGKTVFQEFSCKIDEMLVKQNELRNSEGARADTVKSVQQLQRQQEVEMSKLKDELTKVQVEYAKEFTQEFGPNLARQAENSVRHIVDSIYQKAMTKWKKETASKTIDDGAEEMLDRLKMLVFTSKREGKSLSKDEFASEAERHMQQTNTDLQRFLKTPSELCDEAFRDLEESSGRGGSDNELVFIQLRQLRNDRTPTPTVLDSDQALAPETLSHYFELDRIKAEAAVDNFVKQRPWYQKEEAKIRELRDAIKDEKDKSFVRKGLAAGGQLVVAAGQYVGVCSTPAPASAKEDDIDSIRQRRDARLDSEFVEVLAQVDAAILQFGKSNFEALRKEVMACIKLVQEENSQSQSPQPLPEKVRARLFEAFNKELSQMADANKGGGRANNVEEIAKQCKAHKLMECQQLFTRVYYNLLHAQVLRNEELQKGYIKKKLELKKDEALEFFDEINRRVEGTQGCSSVMMTIVVGAICTVLEGVYKEDLQRALDNLTISKDWVMQEARKAFEEAGDDEQGRKTIVDFMKQPVELEERICRKSYDERTQEALDQQIGFYDALVTRTIANMREFFQGLNTSLSTDTERVNDIRAEGNEAEANRQKKERNVTVLQYLYWSILWQLEGIGDAEEKGVVLAKRNREAAESYQIWGKPLAFPAPGKKIFKNNPDKYDTKTDQARLADISGTLEYEDMSVFMIGLGDIETNEQVEQKLRAARDKLVLALKSVVASNDYESFKSAGIGCRGMCDFCGARCNKVTECTADMFHKSEFHRPMAFKGAHKITDGKKLLLQDFCTSPTNIKSLWEAKSRGNADGNRIIDNLRRLEDLNLKTTGMNVYLEWSTAADLDINVMCGCQKWHGYGTEGGSTGSCQCEPCGMKRDYDIQQGSVGRKAIEHVYFDKPELLVNKQIGVRVHNYGDSQGATYNAFKLCIFNKWGHQLFPNPGEPEAKHEASWMFTNGPKTNSTQRYYPFKPADVNAGRENQYVEFPRHVQEMNARWEFSDADTTNRKEDPEFRKFIAKCNEKWKLVSEKMCADYQAQPLAQVMVL